MPKKRKHSAPRGGARSNAGRPQKLGKDKYSQITCVLRTDTIAQLKAGADSRFFGEFLQKHLDRYPLPSRAQYLAIEKDNLPASFEFYGRYPRGTPSPAASEPKRNYRDEKFRERVALHMAVAQISEEEAVKRLRKFDRNEKPTSARKSML
jgi:hypothetical protein